MMGMVDFVKLISLIQLGLGMAALVLFYLLNILLKIRDRIEKLNLEKIHQLLQLLLQKKMVLSVPTITFLKGNLYSLVQCMLILEKEENRAANWLDIRLQLCEQVLHPEAERLATSQNWFKQYLAILCYYYYPNIANEGILSLLVHSDTLLVSLNAAMLIFKCPTEASVNALIDALFKGRQMNQSMCVEIFTASGEASPLFIDILTSRLDTETDPCVKVFCYMTLCNQPLSPNVPSSLISDICSDNLELKLSAIRYLARTDSIENRKLLRTLLNDEHFEVRAVVAKLLGGLRDEAAAPLLESLLCDPVQWVRVNSAQALASLGKKGILALRRQCLSSNQDDFKEAKMVLALLNSKGL